MLEILRNPRRLIHFCVEGALVSALFFGATLVRLGWGVLAAYRPLAIQAAAYAIVMQITLYYVGHYDVARARTVSATYGRVFRAIILASPALFLLWYLVPSLEAGRGVYLGATALTGLLAPAWRAAGDAIAGKHAPRRQAIIVGTSALAREICRLIKERSDLGLELLGFLASDTDQPSLGGDVVGTYSDLERVAGQLEHGLLVVACEERRGLLPVDHLLAAKVRGTEVEDGLAFYERHAGRVYIPGLHPSDFIFSEAFAVRRGTRRLKRILDIVAATAGLLLSAPLVLLAAVAIRLESRGSFLHTQIRAGEFGDPFTIYKLRSMYADAERHGAQFATENDPRVTYVGRLMRTTRIDELPQLWNVLRGDMSLVGPRPERPEFVETLAKELPFFRQRLYVKPGITGYAQVRSRYGASPEEMAEKLAYDLYYIKHYSIAFDLVVLLDTVKVVLLGRGSR